MRCNICEERAPLQSFKCRSRISTTRYGRSLTAVAVLISDALNSKLPHLFREDHLQVLIHTGIQWSLHINLKTIDKHKAVRSLSAFIEKYCNLRLSYKQFTAYLKPNAFQDRKADLVVGERDNIAVLATELTVHDILYPECNDMVIGSSS